MMSIRSPKNRTFSISTNRGVNWSEASKNTDLKEPACNGDILNYASILGLRNKSCILHSLPNDTTIRQNVSIAVSYDEGIDLAYKENDMSGLFLAYSTMTVLPDGTIGIVVEEGKWDKNLPGEDGFSLYFRRSSHQIGSRTALTDILYPDILPIIINVRLYSTYCQSRPKTSFF